MRKFQIVRLVIIILLALNLNLSHAGWFSSGKKAPIDSCPSVPNGDDGLIRQECIDKECQTACQSYAALGCEYTPPTGLTQNGSQCKIVRSKIAERSCPCNE